MMHILIQIWRWLMQPKCFQLHPQPRRFIFKEMATFNKSSFLLMNGKPDAYSLLSCAAFAIMFLSLSRQIQCGFEVDLLYFFLGCLIVQIMKIKLQLFIVGAGFSYLIIILRSSFSSIDVVIDNEDPTSLQDENLVIIEVNSDSPLLTSADIGSSMVEQLSENRIFKSSPLYIVHTAEDSELGARLDQKTHCKNSALSCAESKKLME
ncbi:exocyst complex component EXO70B1 [Trifolium repens]|nr:exocyst complex component EXO70B1 [Trifolium repens]